MRLTIPIVLLGTTVFGLPSKNEVQSSRYIENSLRNLDRALVTLSNVVRDIDPRMKPNEVATRWPIVDQISFWVTDLLQQDTRDIRVSSERLTVAESNALVSPWNQVERDAEQVSNAWIRINRAITGDTRKKILRILEEQGAAATDYQNAILSRAPSTTGSLYRAMVKAPMQKALQRAIYVYAAPA